jgi:chaperonin GroEL
MFRKICESGVRTQQKFLVGVNKVDALVGGTLGPGGRNRLIQRKYKSPLVVNDGATIARHILLEDPIEDMAAQTIIEISMKTAEQAGDGTTTATVMACELTRHCMERLAEEGQKTILEGGSKTSPMALWKSIQEDRDTILTTLKGREMTIEDIENTISTSLENMEYGKTLAELLKTIGKDGYISVEDNWATQYGITTETTKGMRFLGKYASPYLTTTANKKEALIQDVHVLVTNGRVETVRDIEKILKEMQEKKVTKLVIIGGFSSGADPFGKDFIEAIARAMYASAQGARTKDGSTPMQILAVRASSLTSQELEDVAVFCDAKFFDTSLGMNIKNAKLEDTGFVQKFSVTEDEVNIIGGRGNTDERIAVLKGQLDIEKDQMFAEKLKRRIASLASGVGVIRVGASTESERSYLKYKLEDAVLAVKAGWEEGLVKGGGMAYAELADIVGEESVLYTMLKAPYERIKSNMGVSELEIADTVVDPAKVVRVAIQNACSGAGMLISADGAIAEVKLDYGDFLEKALRKALPTDERDDWRDNENQDPGAGRFID